MLNEHRQLRLADAGKGHEEREEEEQPEKTFE
jgi:hypothetical protein